MFNKNITVWVSSCALLCLVPVMASCTIRKEAVRDESDLRIFSPAAVAARSKMNDVKPGTLVWSPSSIYDVAELLNLQGSSYILKLPDSAPENNRPYIGSQLFVNGRPVGAIKYGGGYIAEYVEPARCWLVDVVVMRDRFSSDMSRAAFTVRVHALDKPSGGRLTEMSRWESITYGDNVKIDPKAYFFFSRTENGAVGVGVDIPVGCWSQFAGNDKLSNDDLLTLAKGSPVAVVFYVRFQKDMPGDK